mgnify:CR=1 FL=1
MSVREKASLECYSFSHVLLKSYAVQAYPDGWTCVDCGDEYSERNTDVEDFYVINTSEGTLCKECNQRR